MRPRLIYFCHEPAGGLADYAHEQANAISELGIHVQFVTAPQFAMHRQPAGYSLVTLLANPPSKFKSRSRLGRWVRSAQWVLDSANRLASYIQCQNVDRILMAAYFEYLAPLWAPKLRRCASKNRIFGTVVHDPVRGTVLGPQWWHRYSIASAYSFVREAFVHHPIELDTVRPVPGLRTTVIPHGPYHFPPASQPKKVVRKRLGIPGEANLLLAFGHLRDGKNLALVLEAMVGCPEFYLLVAGSGLSSRERTAADYRELATRLGVSERCRWDIRRIPEQEVGNLVEASDLVLLTYSASFRSASGVLNVAACFRRPCLASGGESNLRTVVQRYNLGYWVEPDSATEIAAGLRRWLRDKPVPRWDSYAEENSWSQNASLVVEGMFGNARVAVPQRILATQHA